MRMPNGFFPDAVAVSIPLRLTNSHMIRQIRSRIIPATENGDFQKSLRFTISVPS